jgi:hypothetical protein
VAGLLENCEVLKPETQFRATCAHFAGPILKRVNLTYLKICHPSPQAENLPFAFAFACHPLPQAEDLLFVFPRHKKARKPSLLPLNHCTTLGATMLEVQT